MSTTLKFKFQYLDANGSPTGFLSKKGLLDGEHLTLDKTPIPLDAIIRATRRFNNLLVEASTDQLEPAVIAIQISSGSVRKLHSSINQTASARQIKSRQQRLVELGKAHLFRQALCPQCNSTIDLSGFPETPQSHCPYCDVISTLRQDADPDELGHGLCDECNYFSAPREFTIFYFYFLLFLAGYRYQRVYRCTTCMKRSAWKMLWGNLIFILGVPTAVTQLLRAYFGGNRANTVYPNIDHANKLAQQGRYEQAMAAYEAILQQRPNAAGIWFNQGLAAIQAKQYEEAIARLTLALEDCGNYQPAAAALIHCYETLGRKQEVEALKLQWQDPEADDTEAR